MFVKNHLLSLMILCYTMPILYVYFLYHSNNSVSNIICNENCKNYILYFMMAMGFFTVLYELQRNDVFSILCISVLLSCIYGLILYDESYTLHYILAISVFAMILLFNIRHCYLHSCNIILKLSLYISVGLLGYRYTI
jgi:hypothetical protein